MIPFAAPGHPAPRPKTRPGAGNARQRATPRHTPSARSSNLATTVPRATPAIARPSTGTLWLLRGILAAIPVALALFYLSSELAREGRLGFPMDDPYIHFQFARNLAHGAGFSFNPGEPTPGATSPLWVLLLAGGNWLGIPLEPLAIVLGVVSAAFAACMTFEVGLAAGLPLALAFLAGLALGSAGRFTWASLSGMETCLAAGLSLVLMRLGLSPRRSVAPWVAMGLVAGLCAEARPEMFLLGPLVAVLEWRQTRTID